MVDDRVGGGVVGLDARGSFEERGAILRRQRRL